LALVWPLIDITSRAVTKWRTPSFGRRSSKITAARWSGMNVKARERSVTLPAASVALIVSWFWPGFGLYSMAKLPSGPTSSGRPSSSSRAPASLWPRTSIGLWRRMPPSAGSPIWM
jgi:hypothetical protein